MCDYNSKQRGFSLVELVIVVVIIGVIGAIAVPRMSQGTQGAREAALVRNLNVLSEKIYEEYQLSDHDTWPTTVDPEWFARGILPEHPENHFGIPAVQVLDSPTMLHPLFKVLNDDVGGAFWYNPGTGVVRAWVTDQGSAAATIDYYNRVNRSNETSLGNYGGGGGS